MGVKYKMSGLAGYSRPSADGHGVTIDVETMLVDLIMVLKASGAGKVDLISMVDDLWSKVEVSISVPKGSKQ